GLRKGAVYKRMNGDTALTAHELVKLARDFRFSLDTFTENPGFISFLHPFMKQRDSFTFLDGFLSYLQTTENDEESRLTYLANELPVFYYLSYEYIYNFLLAIWNHLHWSDSRLAISYNNKLDAPLQQMSKDINQYYNTQPVTEIWNAKMLSNLYQQVLFSITIKAFTEAEYVTYLLQDIERLIRDLRKITHSGERTSHNAVVPSQIYLNEFGNYLNLVLFSSERTQAVFVGYDMPHFIVTHKPDFYQFSTGWIEKIKRHSVLISEDGYQYRERFFLRLEEEFKRFKVEAERMVEMYYGG
ncbi:MAG: hypothetical protein AAF789_10930, partial [Bacteroidota bacterium]